MGTISNDYQTLNRSENMIDHEYFNLSSDGSFVPALNVNADFDAYIFTNYKLGVEFTFTSIMTFWGDYHYEEMDESEIKMVFYHSLQSIWANIDDVTKKPLKEESVPLIKAHICNCIITRNRTKLARFLDSEDSTNNEAHKEANAATATEEAMVGYLKTMLVKYLYRDEAISIIESDTFNMEVYRQVFISTLNGFANPHAMEAAKHIANCSGEEFRRRITNGLNNVHPLSLKVAKVFEEIMNKQEGCNRNELQLNTLKDSANEAYEGINLKTTQEGSGNTHLSIWFEDTLSQCTTKVHRISVDQPLKEVFQLYAQRNHIPVEKLQFMYLSKRLTWDTLATLRSLRVTKDMENISVFRMFDRIGDNPDQMRFIKLPECTYYDEEEESESAEESIYFMDAVTYKRVQFNVSDAQIKMKKILEAYAKHVGVPFKDLSFSRYIKVMFMSSIRNLTWEKFFSRDDNDNVTPIVVTPKVEQRQEKQERVPLANTTNTRTKKAKKKKHKKSNKKRAQPLVIPKTEAELRGEHSKLLGKVYEEAEPTFKEKRQKLNALNLERTKPKQKKAQSKTTKPVEVVDNPVSDDQLGGKAGKTQFIIQVGEVSNLYKTTKPSPGGRGRRQDDIMIDLHGLTAEEAVYRLDKHLPDWIETAMKGTYPFVIPVKIVCGGGSQILAEVVENWIKQNDHVANAPKNMYS